MGRGGGRREGKGGGGEKEGKGEGKGSGGWEGGVEKEGGKGGGGIRGRGSCKLLRLRGGRRGEEVLSLVGVRGLKSVCVLGVRGENPFRARTIWRANTRTGSKASITFTGNCRWV